MSEEERGPEETKMLRKRGAPAGNQNARKHGFYSKVLTESERLNLETAVDVDGLDNEIALLRVKIKSIVEHDPDNVQLIVRAVNALTRMIMAKKLIGKQEKDGISLKDAVFDVLKDVALPVGIGIANSFKK